MILGEIRVRVEEIKIKIKMSSTKQKDKDTPKLSDRYVGYLHNAAIKDTSDKKIKEGVIILGYLGDDESYKNEDEIKLLEKKSIIISHKLEKFEPEDDPIKIERAFYEPYFEEDENAGHAGDVFLSAVCKFYPDRVANYLRTICKNEKEENSKKENLGEPLITKKGNGFYFRGTEIDFGEDTKYKDVFDILYTNSIQSDFISYETINNELLSKKWEPVSGKKIKKRIQNCITNGIFRFAKINGRKFKNNASANKKLIKIRRGRGVEFNNSMT